MEKFLSWWSGIREGGCWCPAVSLSLLVSSFALQPMALRLPTFRVDLSHLDYSCLGKAPQACLVAHLSLLWESKSSQVVNEG